MLKEYYTSEVQSRYRWLGWLMSVTGNSCLPPPFRAENSITLLPCQTSTAPYTRQSTIGSTEFKIKPLSFVLQILQITKRASWFNCVFSKSNLRGRKASSPSLRVHGDTQGIREVVRYKFPLESSVGPSHHNPAVFTIRPKQVLCHPIKRYS